MSDGIDLGEVLKYKCGNCGADFTGYAGRFRPSCPNANCTSHRYANVHPLNEIRDQLRRIGDLLEAAALQEKP